MRTIVCSILGYCFLLLAVRVLSRRPGAQMTPFEFVLVFLIGGVIILAIVGEDSSITNRGCATLTIALLHRSIAYLKARYRWIRALVDGTPVVLISKGQWRRPVLTRVRIQDMDVMAAARTKNIRTMEEIEYAVLERNGSISIIKYRQ